MSKSLNDAPLALYVHFPWCISKCPYCDFNSHPLSEELPEKEYTDALIADWQAQIPNIGGRKISSVFFGGGTPSLFQPKSFERLIDQLSDRLITGAELTMEANPGTLEYGNLADYHHAGINRLSMGVQSFDDTALKKLGRIHSAAEAATAIEAAQAAGFDNLNIDLMHGLPEQGVNGAINDLQRAIGLGAAHISWYQLTIEPRTEFAKRTPVLPGEETLGHIENEGLQTLAGAGFVRYEISAYARTQKNGVERRSKHNRNYWEFGDYLGIGAGAHGKLSSKNTGTQKNHLTVIRTAQPRQPRLYLQQAKAQAWQIQSAQVADEELPSEFMMNALRLLEGVPEERFVQATGIPLMEIETPLSKWRRMGIIDPVRLALTPMGLNALDTVVADFLP